MGRMGRPDVTGSGWNMRASYHDRELLGDRMERPTKSHPEIVRDIVLALQLLARTIHGGSSRIRAVAGRNGCAEALETQACVNQHVEGKRGVRPLTRGETHMPNCRNGESSMAAEAVMNNAG